MSGAGIEIAGGLVGEDDFRLPDERAGDSDALFLAARELEGKEILTFFEMETAQNFVRGEIAFRSKRIKSVGVGS